MLGERAAVLSASAGIEALLGFSAADFLREKVTFEDRIHPHDADVAGVLFSHQSAEKSGTFNIRLRHADGRIRCVRGEYNREQLDGTGKVALDLLLADANSLYAGPSEPASLTTIDPMMNCVGEALYFKNRNHVFTAANQTTMRSFSKASGNGACLLGKTDYDLFPEEYADLYYGLEKRVLAGATVVSEIHPLPLEAGTKQWINNLKYAVKDPKGAVVGLFGVAHDITGHREVLERLLESEELLREAQSIAGIGSYWVDIATGLWTSSDVLDRLFGINKDYQRTVEGWASVVHPDDRAMMVEYFANDVIGHGKPFDKEYCIVRGSDGAVRWVHGLGRLEFDAQGRPSRMLGTIRDITELKENEIALRHSEESLREAEQIAGLCSYVLNVGTGIWKGSENLEAILGIDAAHPRTVAGWVSLLHPDDRERMSSALAREIARRSTSSSDDYRIVRPLDGAVRWLRGKWRIEYNADGSPAVLRGTMQDITESKQAEIALGDSQKLLQLFIEHAPVAIAMFDGEMRYLAVSHRWAKDHSIADREIIGRSHYEINPEVPERWKETHRRGLAGERQRMEEDRYDRADGSLQWIRWEIIPWLGGDDAVGGIVMFYEDITQRRHAEAALRESKELLQLFIAHAPAALAMFDREMRYVSASRRWLEENSLVERDIIGRLHYEIVPDIPERWKKAHQRGLAGETLRADEDRFERADGTVQWSRWEVIPWRASDGTVGGIILFAEDITKHRETDERLRLAASVFTNAREGIAITDPNGSILEVNEMFTRITGYSREEALGQNPRLLKSGVQSDEFYANMWRSLIDEGHWSGEIWNRNKGGEIIAENLTINSVRDGSGKLLQYVSLFSDITQLKQHAQQLEHMTHYDVLTSLPNRVLLVDRLHQAMAQAKRRRQILAVAYLDLDGFKEINDEHGRDAGNRLLTSLAFDMKCALREGDTLARLGGDEFVAVLIDLDDAAASVSALDQLREAAAEPVQVGNLSLRVSASIGVTFYPQSEEADPDTLLRQADQAMYQAKLAGGNRYHIFDPEHDLTVRGRHENLEHIRQALASREFVLHYQPKVNMRTGKVVGVEALIRWQHPERGLLPPGMFLPVIEDHSLAIEVGEWVIDTALAQMERWSAAGLEIPVSVNVCALQLQQGDFVDRLSGQLAAHPGVKPFSLEIEVLETSALQDVAQTSQVLNACHGIGVSFALDDFGTGYSSLTYLKRLPASTLKIDQSFVSDMLEDPENLNILEGVLGLASAFHRQVIAEGVETVEHGLMLLQLGCELAQGYGIARPMPEREISVWISSWRPDPRWGQVPPVHSGNRSMLYACVEHRAWIAAFESYLMGKRHAPPSMDPRQCRFGKWLEGERLAGRANQPARRSVEAAHGQLHEVAAEIFAAHARGRNSDGLGRLGELHSVCDGLLEQMEVLHH